jgi:hypothetical protein
MRFSSPTFLKLNAQNYQANCVDSKDSFELGTWAPSQDLAETFMARTILPVVVSHGRVCESGRTEELGAMLRISHRRGATPRVSRGEGLYRINPNQQPRASYRECSPLICVSCVRVEDGSVPAAVTYNLSYIEERVLNQLGLCARVTPPITGDGIVLEAFRQHGEEAMSIKVVVVVVRRTFP